MMLKESDCLLLVILGFGFVIGAFWLVWDWANWLAYYLDWSKFWKEACFWLPLFIDCVKANRWTLVFDIALAWAVLGLFMLIVGAYYLGKLRE